jgi:hypothetical protein
MSKDNKDVAKVEDKNQELVNLTLEEAETKAQEIILKASELASGSKSDSEKYCAELIEEAKKKGAELIEEAKIEAKAKAEIEALEIISSAKDSAKIIINDSEVQSKAVKGAKYIAINNIREDQKIIKIGEPYTGKNIKKLLESKAIRVNK